MIRIWARMGEHGVLRMRCNNGREADVNSVQRHSSNGVHQVTIGGDDEWGDDEWG